MLERLSPPGIRKSRRSGEAHESMPPWLQYSASVGNLALGAAGMVFGNFNTMSVLGDALHNVGDSVAYWLKGESIRKADQFTPERTLMYRKLGHWTLFAGSVGAGTKSGYDVYDTWANSAPTSPASAMATAVGAVSLGAALSLGAASEFKIRQRLKNSGETHRTKDERSWTAHVFGLDVASAGIAFLGAGIQHKFPVVEQLLGVANGALGAWLFRPTEHNLSHDHASEKPGADGHAPAGGHGHGHGHGHNHALGHKPKLSERVTDLAQKAWAHATAFATTNRLLGGESDNKVARGLRTAMGAGIVAVGGWAALRTGQEMFSLVDGGSAAALPAAPVAENPAAAPAPVEDHRPPVVTSPVESVPTLPATYPVEALQLAEGEGGYGTLEDLGIPAEQWADLWDDVGWRLGEMEYDDGTSVAYLEDIDGATGVEAEWRLNMSPDGTMSTEALDLIMREATAQ